MSDRPKSPKRRILFRWDSHDDPHIMYRDPRKYRVKRPMSIEALNVVNEENFAAKEEVLNQIKAKRKPDGGKRRTRKRRHHKRKTHRRR